MTASAVGEAAAGGGLLAREIERQCSSQIYDALFDWSAAGFERRQAEYDANEAA